MRWSEGTKRGGHKNRAKMEPLWERNQCFEDVVCVGKYVWIWCNSHRCGKVYPQAGWVPLALRLKAQEALQSETPQNPELPWREDHHKAMNGKFHPWQWPCVTADVSTTKMLNEMTFRLSVRMGWNLSNSPVWAWVRPPESLRVSHHISYKYSRIPIVWCWAFRIRGLHPEGRLSQVRDPAIFVSASLPGLSIYLP